MKPTLCASILTLLLALPSFASSGLRGAEHRDHVGCPTFPPMEALKVKEKFTLPASFEVSTDDEVLGTIRSRPMSNEMILRMGNRAVAKSVVTAGNNWVMDLYNCKGLLIGRILATPKTANSKAYDYQILDASTGTSLLMTSDSTRSVSVFSSRNGSVWTVTRSFSSMLNLWAITATSVRDYVDPRLLAFFPTLKDQLDRETDHILWRD